jgi:hypothetical protein
MESEHWLQEILLPDKSPPTCKPGRKERQFKFAYQRRMN